HIAELSETLAAPTATQAAHKRATRTHACTASGQAGAAQSAAAEARRAGSHAATPAAEAGVPANAAVGDIAQETYAAESDAGRFVDEQRTAGAHPASARRTAA